MKKGFVATITILSEGNPGALNILLEILKLKNEKRSMLAIDKAAEHRIIGPELWLLYKDENNYNLEDTIDDLINETAFSKLKNNRCSKFYESN